MKNASLFIAVSLLCLSWCTGDSFAQTGDRDTIAIDTTRSRFLPTGVRLGYDLISVGKTYFQDNYRGWEVQGDVDFSRYFLALEYGSWQRNEASDSASYNNDGNYWRVGVDVNFMSNDPDRNVFFLGARYGRSTFSESMSVMRHDPVWGLLSDTFEHSDVRASWVELTTGLKVKIWKAVWLGYTARFKFALSATGSPDMLPYDIPGFGITNKETAWGFNYYVMIRLPFRKAPAMPAMQK